MLNLECLCPRAPQSTITIPVLLAVLKKMFIIRSSGIISAKHLQLEMLEPCMQPKMASMHEMFLVTLTKNFYASSEFLNKTLDAYLIVGVLEHSGMKSVDDQPSKNQYERYATNCDEKTYIINTITKFIEDHVVHQIPEAKHPFNA